jgi:hypothetical protein
MDFSDALLALKDRKRLFRTGWHGIGLFVCMQKGYPNGININQNTADATGFAVGESYTFSPYFMLYNAGNFTPWVPSNGDLLATDWYIYSEMIAQA